MDALIAWLTVLIVVALWVGGIVLFVMVMLKVKRKVTRWDKRVQMERAMRSQIEDAEIEAEIARKILRENGQLP
ncbi:hypothetical protein [Leucobacter sp. G161]|uniref:hypothetical protein n=1 Tax=Leucobacter sp. G161 TaxID=663704 RepID=UPI00073B391E|nr:hypothetical protein [Leucobacter sp. G161]KUF08441.1 hypothetical protein AUL38_04615 [Leucobacter sp. G161]